MRIQVTIEETVSQMFEVDANNLEEALELARKRYQSGEYIIEDGNVTSKQMQGFSEENDEISPWIEF